MPSDAEALRDIILLLEPLDEAARGRILAAIASYFNVTSIPPMTAGRSTGTASFEPRLTSSGERRPTFSEDRTASPKDFLLQKQPIPTSRGSLA